MDLHTIRTAVAGGVMASLIAIGASPGIADEGLKISERDEALDSYAVEEIVEYDGTPIEVPFVVYDRYGDFAYPRVEILPGKTEGTQRVRFFMVHRNPFFTADAPFRDSGLARAIVEADLVAAQPRMYDNCTADEAVARRLEHRQAVGPPTWELRVPIVDGVPQTPVETYSYKSEWPFVAYVGGSEADPVPSRVVIQDDRIRYQFESDRGFDWFSRPILASHWEDLYGSRKVTWRHLRTRPNP